MASAFDDLAHVLDTGADRAHLLERPLGAAGDRERQRRLAGAGWPPEDRARQAVLLDQSTQRLALADQVLLTDDIVERARSQASRQRSLAAQKILGGGAEQIVVIATPEHTFVRSAPPLDDVIDQPARRDPLPRDELACRRVSVGCGATPRRTGTTSASGPFVRAAPAFFAVPPPATRTPATRDTRSRNVTCGARARSLPAARATHRRSASRPFAARPVAAASCPASRPARTPARRPTRGDKTTITTPARKCALAIRTEPLTVGLPPADNSAPRETRC